MMIMDENELNLHWIKLGGITGLTSMAVFVAISAVPLPDRASNMLAAFFGPLLSLASYGLVRLLALHRKAISLQIAAVSNAIAGALVTAMLLVQLAVRTGGRGALDDFLWLKLRRIDLGLDVAWDVYICAGTFLLALNMLRHPMFGPVWGGIGLLLATGLAGLNLWTFPTPPANAGWVDLGPLVGLWYAAVSVQMLRSLPWAGSKVRPVTSAAAA